MIDTLKWYSWIPTNLGVLDYNFITPKQMYSNFGKNIKFSEDKTRFWNLDLKNFKDSLSPYITTSHIKEISPTGTISFEILDSSLKGRVSIYYADTFSIGFNYSLERNGKIRIDSPYLGKSNQIKDIDTALMDTFAQIAYMMIKQSLHGDSHHHQKIDYVLKVSRDIFPADIIINTFAKHIKNVERDIKSLDTCIGHLKAMNAIEEIRGYLSYVNTFFALYKEELSQESKVIVENMKKCSHFFGIYCG
ncbi:MAG: hypothetical protein Q9M36_11325 [Sulfurovum sp.]|nr:hypothetical protein [Sulfurovum sp.]